MNIKNIVCYKTAKRLFFFFFNVFKDIFTCTFRDIILEHVFKNNNRKYFCSFGVLTKTKRDADLKHVCTTAWEYNNDDVRIWWSTVWWCTFLRSLPTATELRECKRRCVNSETLDQREEWQTRPKALSALLHIRHLWSTGERNSFYLSLFLNIFLIGHN